MLLVDGDARQTPGHPVFERAKAQETAQKKQQFTDATETAKTKTDKYQKAAGNGTSKKEVKQLKQEAIGAWNTALGHLPDYLRTVGVNAEPGKEKKAIEDEIARLKKDFKGDETDKEIFNSVVDTGGAAVLNQNRHQMRTQLAMSEAGAELTQAQENLETAGADYQSYLDLPSGVRNDPDLAQPKSDARTTLQEAEEAYAEALNNFVSADLDLQLAVKFPDKQGGYTATEYQDAAEALTKQYQTAMGGEGGVDPQLALLVDGIAAGKATGAGVPLDPVTTVSWGLDTQLKRLFGEGNNGVYTPEQWTEAGDKVKARYGGNEEISSFIDISVQGQIKGGEIGDILQRLNTDSTSFNLSEAEEEMLRSSPVNLAVLIAGGVRFGGEGETPPALADGAKRVVLTEEMENLAKTNSPSFAILMLSGVQITTDQRKIPLIITPDAPEGRNLTDAEQRILNTPGAGVEGLANHVASQILGNDPKLTPLLTGGDLVRLNHVTEEMSQRMSGANPDEQAALKFLRNNMESSFSHAAAGAIWETAGAPYFDQSWALQKIDSFDGDISKLGDWMKETFGNAPAQLVPVVFSGVKQRFSIDHYREFSSSPGDLRSHMGSFWEGLATGAELSPEHAPEMAEWLVSNKDGELIEWLTTNAGGFSEHSAPMEFVANGHGDKLAAEFGNRIGRFEQYEGIAEGFKNIFPDIQNMGRQKLHEGFAAEQYADFKAHKNERLNEYFDDFLNDPLLNKTYSRSDIDTPQFRNAIGRAMGLTPNQNLEQARTGDASVDWYAADTRAWHIVDSVISRWISEESDDNSKIRMAPIMYTSARDGVQTGALFEITRGDGETVLIDGLMAINLVDTALGDPLDDDDDKQIDPMKVNGNWKYSDFNELQDDSDYADKGNIYMPANMRVTDENGDGHVDIVERDAGRVSTEEWALFAVDVGVTALSIALIPVSLGASAAIGLGWGALRITDQAMKMHDHGQTLDMSNPNAQMVYLNAAFLGLGAFSSTAGSLARVAANAERLVPAGIMMSNISRSQRIGSVLSNGSRLPAGVRAVASVPGGSQTWHRLSYAGMPAMGWGAYMTYAQVKDVVDHGDTMSGAEKTIGIGSASLGIIEIIGGAGFMGHKRPNPQNEGTTPQASVSSAPMPGAPALSQNGHRFGLAESGLFVPGGSVHGARHPSEIIVARANERPLRPGLEDEPSQLAADGNPGLVVANGHRVPGLRNDGGGQPGHVPGMPRGGINGDGLNGTPLRQNGRSFLPDENGFYNQPIRPDGPPIRPLGDDEATLAALDRDLGGDELLYPPADWSLEAVGARLNDGDAPYRHVQFPTEELLWDVHRQVQATFRGYLPDQPPAPLRTRMMDPANFKATHLFITGREPSPQLGAFADYLPVTGRREGIYLRSGQPFNRLEYAHEIIHGETHPTFRALARNHALSRREGNLEEGVTEFLAFLAEGPEPYRNQPFGLSRLLNAGDDPVVYRRHARMAERIYQEMGQETFYAAVFRGEANALQLFEGIADRYTYRGPLQSRRSRGGNRLANVGNRPVPGYPASGSQDPFSAAGVSSRVGHLARDIWIEEGRQGTGPTPAHTQRARKEIELVDGLIVGTPVNRLPVGADGPPLPRAYLDTIVARREVQLRTDRPDLSDPEIHALATQEVRDAFRISQGRFGRYMLGQLDPATGNILEMPLRARSLTQSRLLSDRWTYDPTTNRTMTLGRNGEQTFLNPGDQLAFYDKETNRTFLLDPENRVIYHFGEGDNRAVNRTLDENFVNPEAAPKKRLKKRTHDRLVDTIDRKARSDRTLSPDDHYRLTLRDATAQLSTEPSPILRELIVVSERFPKLSDYLHDGETRPKGGDRRREGEYYRLVKRAGQYEEMLLSSLGPTLGASVPESISTRRATFKGVEALDRNHYKTHNQILSNYSEWRFYINRIERGGRGGLAHVLDQSVLSGNKTALTTALGQVRAAYGNGFARQLEKLANKQPHLALKAHLAIAGGNPALSKTAEEVFRLNLRNYQDIAGAGHIVLYDELMTPLLKPRKEAFDFGNGEHLRGAATMLAVQRAMGKTIQINAEWGIPKLDGRQAPTVTRDHDYENFDRIVDLIEPFAQDPDCAIIITRAGTHRFVKPRADMVPAHGDEIASYGQTIPLHIQKMEQMLRRAPHVKFEFSSNLPDFVSSPALLDGLATFIRRHPDNVIIGKGAVKPENNGQRLRYMHPFELLVRKLAEQDLAGAPKIVAQISRTNFEGLTDRATNSPLNAAKGREIAARLVEVADQFEALRAVHRRDIGNLPANLRHLQGLAPRMSYQDYGIVSTQLRELADLAVEQARLNPTSNRKRVQHEMIIRAREAWRQEGMKVFNHAINNQANYAALIATPARPSGDAWTDTSVYRSPASGHGAPLPARWKGPRPRNFSYDPDSRQAGMAAGATRTDADPKAVAQSAADGAAIYGGFEAGMTLGADGIYVASAARFAMFAAKLRRDVFTRKLSDEIFEDGQIKHTTLTVFTDRTVKFAREFGVPEENIGKFLEVMGQFRSNLEYIHGATRHMSSDEAAMQRFFLVQWAAGEAEVKAVEALGLSASSFNRDDARIFTGRVNRTVDSGLRSAHTTSLTHAVLDFWSKIPTLGLPERLQTVAYIAGGLVLAGGSARNLAGIVSNTVSNYLGVRRSNPQLYRTVTHSEVASSGLSEVNQSGTLMRIGAEGLKDGVGVSDTVSGLLILGSMGASGVQGYREIMRTMLSRGPRKPPRNEGTARWVERFWATNLANRFAQSELQALGDALRKLIDKLP